MSLARHSPASVSPLDGKGKDQTKTECKTCEALSAARDRGCAGLCGARRCWNPGNRAVARRARALPGPGVPGESAPPRGLSCVGLRGPSPGGVMNPGGCQAVEAIPGYQGLGSLGRV